MRALLLFGSCLIPSNILADATMIQDGTLGAQLGTTMYNSMGDHKPLPMPQSENTIIKETTKNMGAGDSFKDALQKGADTASGVESTSKETPSVAAPPTPSPVEVSPPPTAPTPPVDIKLPNDHGGSHEFREHYTPEYIDKAISKGKAG